MTSVYCKCGSYLGTWCPPTHDQPAESDYDDAVLDINGIPYCSTACLRSVYPIWCAGCKDAAVEIEGNYCQACLTSDPADWVDLDDYIKMRDDVARLECLAKAIVQAQRDLKALADLSDELSCTFTPQDVAYLAEMHISVDESEVAQ